MTVINLNADMGESYGDEPTGAAGAVRKALDERGIRVVPLTEMSL
jgi:lactam utilization protein B